MKLSLWFLLLMFSFASNVFAYMDNYPPFKFSEKLPKQVKAELLVNSENQEYISKDRKIVIRIKEDEKGFDFIFRNDGVVILKIQGWRDPLPYEVYVTDLNGDGLQDFIVFSSYRGNGLAAHIVITDFFLKMPKGGYQNIQYEGFGSDIRDFVDLNNDGKYEIMVCGMWGGETKGNKYHNYFFYNIYEIKDLKLVNVNSKFKGFPKFIWLTEKKNDKDTTHLTSRQKARYASEIDSKFIYREIPNAQR